MDSDGNPRTEHDATRLPDADEIYRKAAKRPGIREVMRVYEDWKRADRSMDTYRAATAWVPIMRNRPNADDR